MDLRQASAQTLQLRVFVFLRVAIVTPSGLVGQLAAVRLLVVVVLAAGLGVRGPGGRVLGLGVGAGPERDTAGHMRALGSSHHM